MEETVSQPEVVDYNAVEMKQIRDAIQQQFDSKLHDQEFKYQAEDFENIPLIIPKMLIYMSKQLTGVVSHCSTQMKEVQAKELKDIFDEKAAVGVLFKEQDLQKQITELKAEKQRLEKKIDDKEDTLATQNENTRARLQMLLDERAEDGKDCVEAILDVDDEDLHFEQPKYDLSDDVMNSDDFNRPRFFSMKQIRNLLFYHLSRSNVNSGVKNQMQLAMSSLNAQMNNSKQELEGLKGFTNKLTDELANEFQGVQDKFTDFETTIVKMFEEQNKKNNDLNQKYIKTVEKIKKLRQGIDEFAVFQEMISNKVDKLNSRLAKFNEVNEQRQKDIQELINARIMEVDNRVNIAYETIKKSEEDMTVKCGSMINDSKEEITGSLNQKMDLLIQEVNASRQKQNETLNTGLQKAKTKIGKIRSACASQFESYDHTIEKVVKQVKVIQDTFEDWTNHVMKPTQMSEARLFSMESRMQEEEDLRIAQVAQIKDVLKKLVFAIEQASLNVLNSRELIVPPKINIPGPASSKNLPGQLPNLLGGPGGKKKTDQTERDQSGGAGPFGRPIDLLFLKRLMYLKQAIEEETQQLLAKTREGTAEGKVALRSKNSTIDTDKRHDSAKKKRSSSMIPSEYRKARKNLSMLPRIDVDALNKSTTIEVENNLRKGKINLHEANNASFLTDMNDASKMEARDLSFEAWGPDLPKESKLTTLEGINIDKERARHFNMKPFASKQQNEFSKESEDPLYYSENF